MFLEGQRTEEVVQWIDLLQTSLYVSSEAAANKLFSRLTFSFI